MKKVKWIWVVTILLTILVLVLEVFGRAKEGVIERNTYGYGTKTAQFQVTIPDVLEGETVEIEVEEQRYSKEETQEKFAEIIEKLDGVILGDNPSFDRVEKNLHLVHSLSGYPMTITWELNRYDVMNTEGEICEDYVQEEGTLVELTGTISYEEEKTVYMRSAMVYPLTRTGTDKWLHEVQKAVVQRQKNTREDAEFTLPTKVAGREVTWVKKTEYKWYYVLLLGVGCSVYVIYREREQVRKREQKRCDALLREYPGMVTKMTMLLRTGATVRSAWEKIVQQSTENSLIYEEMRTTLREMQSGVSEAEAYERFGKRCGHTVYRKFGALLSQNLRKGSKGITEILRMEAIQAFELRKSTAKRLGDEAGTKILLPMLGMLAVVFVMVMVPAFLTMKI